MSLSDRQNVLPTVSVMQGIGGNLTKNLPRPFADLGHLINKWSHCLWSQKHHPPHNPLKMMVDVESNPCEILLPKSNAYS